MLGIGWLPLAVARQRPSVASPCLLTPRAPASPPNSHHVAASRGRAWLGRAAGTAGGRRGFRGPRAAAVGDKRPCKPAGGAARQVKPRRAGGARPCVLAMTLPCAHVLNSCCTTRHCTPRPRQGSLSGEGGPMGGLPFPPGKVSLQDRPAITLAHRAEEPETLQRRRDQQLSWHNVTGLFDHHTNFVSCWKRIRPLFPDAPSPWPMPGTSTRAVWLGSTCHPCGALLRKIRTSQTPAARDVGCRSCWYRPMRPPPPQANDTLPASTRSGSWAVGGAATRGGRSAMGREASCKALIVLIRGPQDMQCQRRHAHPACARLGKWRASWT